MNTCKPEGCRKWRPRGGMSCVGGVSAVFHPRREPVSSFGSRWADCSEGISSPQQAGCSEGSLENRLAVKTGWFPISAQAFVLFSSSGCSRTSERHAFASHPSVNLERWIPVVSATFLHSPVTVFVFCGGALGGYVYILVFPRFLIF